MANFASGIGRFAVPLALGAAVAQSCIFDVQPGQHVIKFDRLSGVGQQAIGEGTHFLIPFLQRPIYFDTRIKPRSISTTTSSKDLQGTSVTLRILSRPDISRLAQIWSTLGTDYDERILPSIANETLKATISLYTAEQLLTQRSEVSARIRTQLSERASEFGIKLDDVAIVSLNFQPEFLAAVEQKVVAAQKAERLRFVVEQTEKEREANVIKAEGEAEAAALVGQALSKAGESYIALQKIDSAKAIATSLAGNRNVTYLPASNAGMLMQVPT